MANREQDCDTYFLSTTARRVWEQNDSYGLDRMFSCLSQEQKPLYFKRVRYHLTYVPEELTLELAEDAFLQTWEAFNLRGKTGGLNITGQYYTGYFYKAFKNNYLKLLGYELKNHEAAKSYSHTADSIFEEKWDDSREIRDRVRKTLDKMSEDCKKLLQWRYMESVDYDTIASKKNIERKSAIHMVWRCAERFRTIWDSSKN